MVVIYGYMMGYIYICISGWWLTYPSEKPWSSSIGMMTFPINMESHKIHVPNHQPD